MTIESRGDMLPYFVPGVKGRDAFGNRMFTSRDCEYHDREGKLTKAGLLVSPEGEQFLHTYRGILGEIEKGLWTLKFEGSMQLPHGLMRRLAEGHQSKVYFLSCQPEIVVKTVQDYTDIDQPYVNEMLQVQELTGEFGRFSTMFGVYFPRILWASSTVSVSLYEHGIYPTDRELTDETPLGFCSVVGEYVRDQRESGRPLWKNIYPDFEHRLDFEPRKNNFIKREDGSLVWIDPVFYSTIDEETIRRIRMTRPDENRAQGN